MREVAAVGIAHFAVEGRQRRGRRRPSRGADASEKMSTAVGRSVLGAARGAAVRSSPAEPAAAGRGPSAAVARHRVEPAGLGPLGFLGLCGAAAPDGERVHRVAPVRERDAPLEVPAGDQRLRKTAGCMFSKPNNPASVSVSARTFPFLFLLSVSVPVGFR